jgi:hypothetical protein
MIRRLSLVEQGLLNVNLPPHRSTERRPRLCVCVCDSFAQSLVFCVVLCRSLFVILSIFFGVINSGRH